MLQTIARPHTKARCEQSDIEIGNEFLRIGIEHANPGGNVTGKADTDDFKNSFEDEEH